VRDLRRSVLVETPDLEADSKRSSAAGGVSVASAYDAAGTIAGPSEKRERQRSISEKRVSQVLRNDKASSHSKSTSQGSNTSHVSTPGHPRPAYLSSSSNNTPQGRDRSGSTSHNRSGSSSGTQTAVNRADVRASAERILYTYLLPGAEREIILPQSVVNEITEEIEQNGRDDPEVFDAAKDYVFQAMDRDAFPGFLQSKALGNLVPPSITMRLILGLIGLFAGFWVGFVLIFLDYSRVTRCYVSSRCMDMSHYFTNSI
jgi:hypothetical protein